MTEATLELTQIRKVINVSDFEHEQFPDRVTGRVIHIFTALFASERQDPYLYYTPKSWWQMLKDKHAPSWFRKRWPVQRNEHKVDVKLLYPRLKSQLPVLSMGERVCLMVNGLDHTHFSMFDPENGLTSVETYRKIAEKMPLAPRDACPLCGKSI